MHELPSGTQIAVRTEAILPVSREFPLSGTRRKKASKDKDGSNTETAGEVVRSCLIESRKAAVTSYPSFHSMLHENHGRLRSRRSHNA
jgi:hypothetical protein